MTQGADPDGSLCGASDGSCTFYRMPLSKKSEAGTDPASRLERVAPRTRLCACAFQTWMTADQQAQAYLQQVQISLMMPSSQPCSLLVPNGPIDQSNQMHKLYQLDHKAPEVGWKADLTFNSKIKFI